MTKVYALLAGLAVIGLGIGTYVVMSGRTETACGASVVAGGAGSIGGPFTLVDETGQTVSEAEVIDQPALIYFGYTFCPDICSIDVARNAVAVDILEERGITVKPVFITIDPARDTVEVVREFTDAFHPRMLGLTGTPEQVKAASQAYRTFYSKADTGDDEFYLMDHSTFSYLSLPGQGFVEFFRRDATPEEMADRMQCFVENS